MTAAVSTEEVESWKTPYIKRLKHDVVPEGVHEKNFRMKASMFTLIDDKLSRRTASGPALRCVAEDGEATILVRLHEGGCGSHVGGRYSASKVLRMGFWWPTMRKDSTGHVKRCDACQRFATLQQIPSEELHSILAPWPFVKWGSDIMGPMPPASGQRVLMLAMTDYFTKWAEAEAYSKVKDKGVISFIKRNILTRFGVPSEIVCDNGSQFISKKTRDFCSSFRIKLMTSSPRYPQSNGQAESTNKIIVEALRKKCMRAQGRWADELQQILRADRTTPKADGP